MADFRQRIETTYADLRPSDLVIDKAGQAWPLTELAAVVDQTSAFGVSFWLLDPVTKVRAHLITKQNGDAVTVSRIPSHADEAAKLEAEFPETAFEMVERKGEATRVEVERIKEMAEAVAAVEEIGGTVEAEVTAEEVDAAAAATEDAPVTLPPFEDMTPLERRSHLYLLHGIYATDVRSNDELIQMHNDAGTVQSKTVPHVHEVK